MTDINYHFKKIQNHLPVAYTNAKLQYVHIYQSLW